MIKDTREKTRIVAQALFTRTVFTDVCERECLSLAEGLRNVGWEVLSVGEGDSAWRDDDTAALQLEPLYRPTLSVSHACDCAE